MSKIDFPKPLKTLLEESGLHGPIRVLADRTGEILADNKLPFFPDYTDHGTDHINAVLKSEVELIPKQVLENSKQVSDPRLLCDADAAVIIGATLLHDIAMHLRPHGFLELIGRESRFQSLPWFKEDHEGHAADCPWHKLWDDFQREARRFSDRQLCNIVGEESARVWKFDDIPKDTGRWELNHCLIIGEFIRRHHARLAHEIAIYGFPGLPIGSGEGQFPAMGKEDGHPIKRLADLIGLTARSHGTSLRVCKAYLEASPLYPGTPRPMGTAVLYPMALLRVADYLQINSQRAPAVLLQLRNPQSPISVQEWKKHRAVQQIGPANDPRGKMVTVSTDLSLSLYLQLKDLLAGLQAEMDHATAVLDEAYGTMAELGLNQLNLATRRVYSNLQSPAYRDSLPYVPKRTGFSADPNLLTLLVEPLYGKKPGVGVRELMQNGADAVRELAAWSKSHKVSINSLHLPEQDCDVLIEYIKRDNGTWFLRVRDRGIGMRGDTIQDYFLRAGASFRRSAEWAKEFLDEKGHPKVIRAGHFGIGAFAIFLLGPCFRLWTRYAGADKSMGHTIEASVSSQLIEIRRVDGLPIGTTIEVELSNESIKGLQLEGEYTKVYGPNCYVDWFCWDWPKVTQRVIRGPQPEILAQKHTCPIQKSNLPPDWSVIHPNGFDAVFWTFGNYPDLSCNGLKVEGESFGISESSFSFSWPENAKLRRPRVAVLDSAASLPLTTQRYGLSQATVPFVDDLVRDVTLSFIAHALVCGPESPEEVLAKVRRHPLAPNPLSKHQTHNYSKSSFDEGLLRWCTTAEAMVPADPSLYMLLNSTNCIVYGELGIGNAGFVKSGLPLRASTAGFAKLLWQGYIEKGFTKESSLFALSEVLGVFAREGVRCLGSAVAVHVLAYFLPELPYRAEMHEEHPFLRRKEGYINSASPIWTEVAGRDSTRFWAEAQTGEMIGAVPLEPILETWEAEYRGNFNNPRNNVLFVAEVRTKPTNGPESILAKIWNECLGPKPIPFNPASRKALIDAGSNHPELKRHLSAWQEIKRTDANTCSPTR
jgi:molecular chaperone HtpG